MLTFLRWFVGCWHKWGLWTDYRIDGLVGQRRECDRCGKAVIRYVPKPY